ncbi:MAG: M48 family metallopeptidase, partial [Burkholderiales bacterium]
MKEKTVNLSGREMRYVLKRSSRRTVGLRITPGGLTVSIPLRMPEYGIESILKAKAGWILKKLDETKPLPVRQWTDGEEIPYLGTHHALRIVHAARAKADMKEGFLEVALPEARPEKIEAAVIGWYKRQALDCFAERIAHYC